MNPLCKPDPEVFLYGARHLLAVLHTAGSIVLLGACTHHLLLMRHYIKGRLERAPLEKLYAKIIGIAYVVTFGLGALLYPTYRTLIRGYYLDRFAPSYSGFFDVKETFAALALMVVLGLFALAYKWKPKDEPALAPIVAAMSLVVCCVVWFNAIVGVWLVSVRGVG